MDLSRIRRQVARLGCRFKDLGPFLSVGVARRQGVALAFDSVRTEEVDDATVARLEALPDQSGPAAFWEAVTRGA